MSATFLVTGFEPFGEHRTNSSWDALELLRDTWPGAIAARRLPVDYRAAHEALREHLRELKPRAVLCTGLAKGSVFRVELRARQPPALRHEAGAAELQGRWPWQEMRDALDASSVAHIDSLDAGQYVCESTYWSLLSAPPSLAPEHAAFLHVPPASNEYSVARIAQAVGQVVLARYGGLFPALA